MKLAEKIISINESEITANHKGVTYSIDSKKAKEYIVDKTSKTKTFPDDTPEDIKERTERFKKAPASSGMFAELVSEEVFLGGDKAVKKLLKLKVITAK